jgi:uncharacterized glyoxalase superfamily protein PhnB
LKILGIKLAVNHPLYTELIGKSAVQCAPDLEKDEQEKAKQLFDALSVNGQIEMPLEKTFWGANSKYLYKG